MSNAWWSSFLTALKLGLTSFGGPTAHIGFFREEYVVRKRWIDDAGFADLNALCQLLPGPASSQVGIGIGYLRAGLPGAVMAWLGFTLPSALLMALFAYLYSSLSTPLHTGWLHGLELAAVAIVAGALLGMAKSLAPDRSRATIAILSAAVVLLVDQAWAQFAVMGAAAAAGIYLYNKEQPSSPAQAANDSVRPIHSARKHIGFICLVLFAVLLIGLPIVSSASEFKPLLLFESFYRSGALVFGGGHVVLPLLERETVQAGWITQQQFVAGYGAVQAMPGPLFTFASYLGAAAGGWPGAILTTIAVFLPGFLLVVGVLPFWSSWQRFRPVRGVIYGINAAVVGILLAALYDPLFTGAVKSDVDFAFLAILYLFMSRWKLPPWALVILAAAGGWAIYGVPFENVSIN